MTTSRVEITSKLIPDWGAKTSLLGLARCDAMLHNVLCLLAQKLSHRTRPKDQESFSYQTRSCACDTKWEPILCGKLEVPRPVGLFCWVERCRIFDVLASEFRQVVKDKYWDILRFRVYCTSLPTAVVRNHSSRCEKWRGFMILRAFH